MFLKCLAIRSLLLMVGKLSIALFCFLYHIAIREMRQGHCCPVKRMSMTYLRIHPHPPPPPVIPIITTSLNVTAEIDEFKNDVGLFLSGQQPPYVLQAMTLGQKYHLLKHHFVPSRDYTFPEEYMGGCKRRFKLNWLNEMPGLVYSPLLDGAFCLPCTIFVTDRDKYGLLVNKPFRAWSQI